MKKTTTNQLSLFKGRLLRSSTLALVTLGLIGFSTAQAQTTNLYWSASSNSTYGGTGTWNTTNTNSTWWNTNNSTAVAWTNNNTTSDLAIFAGTAGTVSLGTNISAYGVQFTTTGYTLTNSGSSTLTLGSGGIDASALSSGTTAIKNTVFVGNGFQTWKVGAGATLALGAIGAGADATDTYTPNGAIVFVNNTGTITTTNVNGWGWRGATGHTGPGLLGPGFVLDNGNNTYDWASANSGTIGVATYTSANNEDANNVRITSNQTVSPNASWASLLVSNSILTDNGANLYIDTGIILEKGGTINGSGPIKANADGLYVYVPDSGTISSSIQNNAANAKKLYMSGTGTLTLSGNNSYSAGTILNGGAVVVGNNNAFGSGAVTFNTNATVAAAGNYTVANAYSIAGGAVGTFDVSSGNNLTNSGVISGLGGLTKIDSGTLTLSGTNTYTGGTILNAGTLALNVTNAIDGVGTVTVNAGTLSLGTNNAINSNNAVTVSGGTFALGAFSDTVGAVNLSSGSITGSTGVLTSTGGISTTNGLISAIIGGGSSLTQNGVGTTTLTGNNSYSGTTTINAGQLNVRGTNSGGGAVAVNGGGVLGVGNAAHGSLGGSTVTVVGGTTAGTQGTIDLNGGTYSTLSVANLTLGGNAGSNSILNFDVGATNNSSITVTSVLTLNAGGATITYNNIGFSIVPGRTNTLITYGSTAGSGVFTLANTNISFGVTGYLTNTATTEELITTGVSAPTTAYYSGGFGTTWTNNNGTYGNFTTNGTFVSTNSANNVQSWPSAASTVIYNNSTNVTSTLGQNFTVGNLNFTGTGTTTLAADGSTLTVGNGLVVTNGSGPVTIGANLAGTGAVTNLGTLTLSGTNSYSGGTTVNGGALTAGASNAFGTGALLLTNSSTATLNGNNIAVAALSGDSGSTLQNGNATTNVTLTINGSSAATFAGTLANGSTGTLALALTGRGTETLSGSNSYTGGTTLNNGLLVLGSSNAIGGSGTISFGGGTLQYSASNTNDYSARFSTNARQA